MKLDAKFDGERIRIPVDVYKEFLSVYVEYGSDKKLAEEAKDSLEFVDSLGM